MSEVIPEVVPFSPNEVETTSSGFYEALLYKLAALEKFQRTVRETRNVHELMRTGLDETRRLIRFRVCGFYTVTEDGIFELTLAEPFIQSADLQAIIDKEIDAGTFAWALRQTRPIIVRNEATGLRVLLGALATVSRVLGMFVGIIEDEEARAAEDVQGLLSLILLGVTYTLENHQLLGELRIYNENLQKSVDERTFEITKINADLQIEIEERKRREADLQAAKSAAESANRAKSEFLAVMSHEIRTPMSGVIGFASLLETTELTGEQVEYVKLINSSGQQLLSLLNDVLDFSKIEAGSVQLEKHSFDLRELIYGLVNIFASRAHEKKVDLICDVEEAVPEKFIGDSTRLRQIVTNLLGNALKFTEKGEIVLTVYWAEPTPDEVEMGQLTPYLIWTVRDSGIGLSPEGIEKLFKPFSQADSSTNRKFGGTGLGLVICRRLCELMGGRIWVESKLGHGASFKFTLPLTVLPEEALVPVPLTPLIPELLGKRVSLLVPHPRSREVLTRQFQRWGLVVSGTSESLAEALLEMEKNAPDLILADAVALGSESMEVWKNIRTHCANLPCLVLTQVRSEREQMEAKADLQTVCLLKPLPTEILKTSVVRLLSPQLSPTAVKPAGGSPTSTRISLPQAEVPLEILVVDDNPMNLKVGSQFLQAMKHHVITATNGRHAIESLQARPFDLLLIDVNMPEMDGMETVRLIRRGSAGLRAAQIYTVAWTALATKNDQDNCLAAGMNDFLTKPLNLVELQRVLEVCTKRKLAGRT